MSGLKDFSAESGERIFAVADDQIITDHLARYRYAADYIRQSFSTGTDTFGADVFCGSGYGANMLAQVAGTTVLAVDGSGEAISRANEAFPRANILFSHKLYPFHLPKHTFDYLCSFESIEHVLDYEAFAKTLSDGLKPGGLLFVSCPNADRIDLELNPYHWHFKHLTPDEFEQVFSNLGLTLLQRASTQCVVPDAERRVVSVNHFNVPRNEIKDYLVGDTLFYIFKKGNV